MERWQHNLEHGCIVLLYHPCLSSKQQGEVISLLSNCLKKYVSTPSLLTSASYPVILVGWGSYRQFSKGRIFKIQINIKFTWHFSNYIFSIGSSILFCFLFKKPFLKAGQRLHEGFY